jgi:NAD(P)-dependent dehydrogenase (short-subunit alcohol dehydrogenase family)
MLDFAGRAGAALVTGGSGGLGAAVCRMLAERGSDVALTYNRNAAAAAAVVAEVEGHGRRASAHQLSLEDADATAAYLERVVAEFGGIHTLVHAAGPHVRQVHLSKVPPAEFRRQVEQEVVAFFNLVQPALAHLRPVQGNIVGNQQFVDDILMPGIRDAVDNRDFILFGDNSRQAANLAT